MTTNFKAVPFVNFKNALQVQFETLKALGNLYVVDVPKDELYDLYLESFPEGTNNILKERREYDCNCCKSFIRTAGRVVAIHNNKVVSLWDVQVGGYYQVVADALKARIEAASIADRFFHFERHTGTNKNVSLQDGQTITWDHFYQVLPAEVVKPGAELPSTLGKFRDQKNVLLRALTELTLDAGQTVLDLIAQNSLYRGDEQRSVVEVFVRQKKLFDKLSSQSEREAFAWKLAGTMGEQSKFRNNAIGQLLIDLSEGKDLEVAVKAWEAMTAPSNYKRPTALETPAMISKALETVVELGLQDSLTRRYAVTSDLTINNVLFADRSAKVQMNVFDVLLAESKGKPKSLDKVEEIGIEDFIANVLPKVDTIEAFVENKLSGNLASLIAPCNPEAPNMLKWNNNFSWSYNGEVTDSIKERVKSAGGNVDGELRISLSWHNGDDLDLHLREPSGDHLYFGTRNSRSRNGGMLDVDMNAGHAANPVDPVENIIYPRGKKVANGTYFVTVNNYSKRDHKNPEGFEVEVEHEGSTYTFTQRVNPRGAPLQVVEFTIENGKLVIGKNIGYTSQTKDLWGVKTESFQKVALVMNSPNFWDGQTNGNKHYFFMLEGCANPDSTRGFYNEYLRDELYEHRKVFERLGSKLKAEHSAEQLSGLGFSSTQRNELLVKVSGSFNRTLKIKF